MTTVAQRCSVDICTRSESFKSSGLCRPHYLRKERGSKNWDGPLKKQNVMTGGCSVNDCSRAIKTSGLCNVHYIRKRKNKDMSAPIFERGDGTCSVIDCERPHCAKGYCQTHWQRIKFGRDLEAPVRLKDPTRGCNYPDCERKHDGHGFCGTHRYIKTRFNLTDQAIINRAHAVCAICQEPEVQENRGLCIDHDHRCCPGEQSCGKCVRGYLCSNCNRALGLFQDNVRLLESAARYLKDPPRIQ